jgi:hypothetical protein
MITRLIDGLHYVHPSDYEIKRQEVLDQSERIAKLEAALRPFAQMAHHDDCTHYECELRRNAIRAMRGEGEK